MLEGSSLIRSVSSRFSFRRSKRQTQMLEVPADSPPSYHDLSVTVSVTRSSSSSTASSSRHNTVEQRHRPQRDVTVSVAQQQDFGLGYSSIGYERRRVSSNRHSRILFDPAELDSQLPRCSTPSSPKRKRSLMRFGSLNGRKERALSTTYECILDENVKDSSSHVELLCLPVVDLTVRPVSRSGIASSVRSSALPVRPTSPPPRSPYTIVKPEYHSLLDAAATSSMGAAQKTQPRRDSLSTGPFYAVARGWKKGVYTSHDEALRQMQGFPGPVMLTFDDKEQARAFVQPASVPPMSTSQNCTPTYGEQDEERLERARIFTGLDRARANCRSMFLSLERTEAQFPSPL